MSEASKDYSEITGNFEADYKTDLESLILIKPARINTYIAASGCSSQSYFSKPKFLEVLSRRFHATSLMFSF